MENNFEVLILCGGEGKRLRSMISEVPKPMAPIGEKPFLHFLVSAIEKQGFKNFCFLTGYKSEIISEYFVTNFNHLNLRFSVEEKPLGTGGAIFKAIKNAKKDHFIVINGDTFFDIDLALFIENFKSGTFKIALRKVNDSSRYGRVESDQNNRVVSFLEKNTGAASQKEGMINGGIYVVDSSILTLSNKEIDFVSLENDIFPLLLEEKKIFSQPFENDFIDIGIPEDYIRAKALIEDWASRPR